MCRTIIIVVSAHVHGIRILVVRVVLVEFAMLGNNCNLYVVSCSLHISNVINVNGAHLICILSMSIRDCRIIDRISNILNHVGIMRTTISVISSVFVIPLV